MQVWRLAFSFDIAASYAEQLRKPRYTEQGFIPFYSRICKVRCIFLLYK